MSGVRQWWLLLAVGLAGCATGQFSGVSPERIPDLESRVARGTDDSELLLALGEAYYAAERFADAVTYLDSVVVIDPSNVEAQLYLAFAVDALDELPRARELYEDLAGRNLGPGIRSAVENRLELLRRRETIAAARETIAREAVLGAQQPNPNTVAVMPLRFVGIDEQFRPLERGLAELIVSDLGAVSRLTVVERLRLQALVDEMRLSESGRVDPASGARAGRLTRAETVVQGSFGDDDQGNLRIDATMVSSSTSQIVGSPSVVDRLEQLFEVEKQVVFEIIGLLGIQLTPAEAARLAERPTASLQAFLAYSRGLSERDNGDFAAAAASFRQAVGIDPGFGLAQSAVRQTGRLTGSATMQPRELVSRVQRSSNRAAARDRLRRTIARVAPSSGDLLNRVAGDQQNAAERKGVQEGTDTQGPVDAVRNTTVVITVKRPSK